MTVIGNTIYLNFNTLIYCQRKKKEKKIKKERERERKRNLTLLFKKIMIHIVTISDLNCKAYIFLYWEISLEIKF